MSKPVKDEMVEKVEQFLSHINVLYTGNSSTSSTEDLFYCTNCVDPGEMLHNAAFHQGIHCLLGKKDLQSKKYFFTMDSKVCQPV